MKDYFLFFKQMIEYIDSLNPREAKILNTYVNLRNDTNEEYVNEGLLDDSTYKHDENDVDYKTILKQKIGYFPPDYKELVQRFRTQTENLTINEKYAKACETLYWMSFVIDHKNMFNVKDEINQALFDFMKYTDDFKHYDELIDFYEQQIFEMSEDSAEDSVS